MFEIQSEWMRIVQNAGENEVERAKQQLKTSLMGGMDSTSQLCEEIGRQMLTLGRRMSPQVCEKNNNNEQIVKKNAKKCFLFTCPLPLN